MKLIDIDDYTKEELKVIDKFILSQKKSSDSVIFEDDLKKAIMTRKITRDKDAQIRKLKKELKMIKILNKKSSIKKEKPKEPLIEENKEEISKPKQTYKQDWKSYNDAKTNEDRLFKHLMVELFGNIKCVNNKVGRKGFDLKTKLFSMCIKIYYGKNSRHCDSILDDLKRLGYISKVPCYRSIINFFNDENMVKILEHLIIITALPLVDAEIVGAIDSSGISASKYECWNHHKWKAKNKSNKSKFWTKLHICCGCRTNIIISAKVTDKRKADSTMLEHLLRPNIKHMKLTDIVADKAYLSRKNFGVTNDLGMELLVPFKENSRPYNKGCGLWSKSYHYFMYKNEEFKERYHKRSNVETVFHMIKSKFGSYVFSKKFNSITVEILVKVLCHNICVLIQEMYELGISVDFDEIFRTYGAWEKTKEKGEI